MEGGIIAIIITVATLVGGAIGWLSRQYRHHRMAKREATKDAVETLNERKTLLQEMLNEIEDANQKEELSLKLDEVNAVLLGLHSERLRRTLKSAGLPPEEALIADGLNQLQPQQVEQLKEDIAELQSLPQSGSIWDLLALSKAYYYAEQYEEAKNIYDKILKLNPDNPDILINRGVTYRHLERYDDALADYNRLLELRPDDPDILINRGVTYRHLERYDDSLADLNRSLELRPDDNVALHNRGNTFADLRKYEEALADVNRSLELRPDYPDTLTARGIIYAELERYDEALADFQRVLELKPNDPHKLYNLAWLFSLWGKTGEALDYLEKTVDRDNKYREMAKTDKDFDNIRDAPRFKKLIE